MFFKVLVILTAISFLGYGLNCMINAKMTHEFERFGLVKFRKLTAVLQLLGATGLLLGLRYPLLILASSAGLALLMMLGVIVRIKIKDGLVLSLPALILMLVNMYIFYASYFYLY